MNTDKTAAMTSGAKIAHTVQMEKRKRTVITGVLDVYSFHENEIVMQLEDSRLILTGQGLHIGKLLPEENRLDIHGQVDGLLYEAPGRLSSRAWPWRRKHV